MWFGVRRTEAPLTWFQLYDLHSSQLPGFNVPSLKGTTTVSQSRNLIRYLFTNCCGWTKSSQLHSLLMHGVFFQGKYSEYCCFWGEWEQKLKYLVLDFQNQQEDCVTGYQTRQDAGGSWPG